MQIEIANVEQAIQSEIDSRCTQKTIAQTYALGMKSSHPADWPAINRAIIKRWSVAGLVRIKKMAWSGSCFRQKEQK